MTILRGTALPHLSSQHFLEMGGKGLVRLLCCHLPQVLAWHLTAFNVFIPPAAQKGGELLFVPIGNGELKHWETKYAAQLQKETGLGQGTEHKSLQP